MVEWFIDGLIDTWESFKRGWVYLFYPDIQVQRQMCEDFERELAMHQELARSLAGDVERMGITIGPEPYVERVELPDGLVQVLPTWHE